MLLLPFLVHTRRDLSLVAVACFALTSCQGLAESEANAGATVAFARGASLSEDDELAKDLQRSLDSFLASLCQGEWSAAETDAAERERNSFFFSSVMRGAQDTEPVVLKSYPVDGGAHLITIAFVAGQPDALAFSRIVEFEAVPVASGFRFRSPYERNTADLQQREIGDVTFRFSGSFDEARASEFARFKAKLEGLQGCGAEPLQYDCFQDLEELLCAFGLVHDRSKCNFLRYDLGFLWDDGKRFATGTGNESYRFGYVADALTAGAADSDSVYRPYVNGVAAYYGGYSLSGDSVEVLARQFRDELERRPELDFLAEFQKGRKSSVERHFSYYVMCAFLCQEIVARRGEAAALSLVECGADGERFFCELDALIGVNEQNFHDTIVRLIGA